MEMRKDDKFRIASLLLRHLFSYFFFMIVTHREREREREREAETQAEGEAGSMPRSPM